MIKVTAQGGKTIQIDFKQGMKVKDVLKAAKIEATNKATISVNGKPANTDTVIDDNSVVIITPKVSNG